MEYHVLSNYDIGQILVYGGFSLAIIWALFGFFAARDASNNLQTKSLWRKVIPWLVFCILLSEICLFIYRCVDYPWEIKPLPSPASAFREKNEMVTGYPIWGWANDYQLPLLTTFAGVLLWFGWTIYAFNFKPSNTSWWKKVCKIIAYIILSTTILGFQLHQYGDMWGYAIILVAVVILLRIAHVKPESKRVNTFEGATVESSQLAPVEIAEASAPQKNEDPFRFMPKGAVSEEIIEPASIETSKPIKQEEEIHEVTSVPSDPIIEEVDVPVAVPVNEHLPQNEITQFEEPDMMYCKHCGKRIESDSTFCKYCGKRL